ncbi:mechanosensitive ion channel family protein [Methanoregula sp.]|jgi:small-conductance mechanosensitive channel|uniref:mechanosensitive ion channel family protein n=1 Tax=Methanoregula sp. TaxID=2052170 RepID=UPI003567800A
MNILDFFNLTLPSTTDIESTVTSDNNFFGTISPRDVFIFFVGIIVAYILGLVISHHIRVRMSHRLKKDQLDILTGIIRAVLMIIAIGISLPGLLDLSITILLLGLVAIITIIGLSSQKVISNMIAGLALLYESPFATGDFISTGAVSGTVVSIRLFSVRIRTTDGIYIHIPNDQIYSTTVSNNHANVARRFVYSVGIRYQDDVKKAEEIIEKILDDYTFVLKNPAPAVFVSDITPDSVVLMIRAWFPSNWKLTQDDISLSTAILPRIKDALEAAGIEIPYAQRVVWFANQPTLPADIASKQQ